MSLDDKFNPNDGSLIDRLDNAFFRFSKAIAVKWQDKTHKSKAVLEGALYFGSAASLGIYTIYSSTYFMAIPAVVNGFKGANAWLRPRSSKEEEMHMELIGLPGKITKYMNLLLYGMGIVMTTIGIGTLATGDYADSAKFFAQGLGILKWVVADYMSKSNIGDPPPKPKKKPLLERLRDRIGNILPQPTPVPNPGAYSGISNYSASPPIN